MKTTLALVPTQSLKRLHESLSGKRVMMPLTRSTLVDQGIEHAEQLSLLFHGQSRELCMTLLEIVLSEREYLQRSSPELVWSGPEDRRAKTRDTAIVLRELFLSARKRVILAGYSFMNSEHLLQPLHQVMTQFSVESHSFIDIRQPEGSTVATEVHGQQEMTKFIEENWTFGEPYPQVYCDRRALTTGPPWSSLHAKCVSVDGSRAMVSSANFTARGQDRNIEAGVLLEDPEFSEHLEGQWMSLIDSGLVLKHRLAAR